MQRPVSELQRKLFYLWNFYPPFLGSGIRIEKVARDCSFVDVRLRLHWWNRNYIGTMFGGSMYMMCDPFHMVLLIMHLGSGYIVRDKGAEIRFLKKATGVVRARFVITPADLAQIHEEPQEVQERRFFVQLKDEAGEVVAEVNKVLHIRRKRL